MADAPNTPSRVSRQKKSRRANTGRRRWPETDALAPMADDELHEIERKFARLRDLEPVDRKDADTVVRLIAEVRRLRELVAVAREHVKPGEASCASCIITVDRLLEEGPDAIPSALRHDPETCAARRTEAIEREEGHG
jgi:hypothetical protein